MGTPSSFEVLATADPHPACNPPVGVDAYLIVGSRPMKPLTVAEEQAGRIVAAYHDCNFVQLDPGGGRAQLPDLELRDAFGRRIGIVEVTSVQPDLVLAFRRAARKYEIEDPSIRSTWFLVFRTADINVKALRTTLPPALRLAEEVGFTPASPEPLVPHFNYQEGQEPQTTLYELGVHMVAARPGASIKPGLVLLNPPAQGGAIGPDMVTDTANECLRDTGNIAKLATANRGELSEYFVWIDEGHASAALVVSQLHKDIPTTQPSDGPMVPHGVTGVWVATGPNDPNYLARALWRSDGGQWRVLDPIRRL